MHSYQKIIGTKSAPVTFTGTGARQVVAHNLPMKPVICLFQATGTNTTAWTVKRNPADASDDDQNVVVYATSGVTFTMLPIGRS